jgi:uncharacterized membrane protein SpoIIM required for sporulation
VDIDHFLADNRATWDRLAELTARPKKLSADEVRELSRLHQRAAGQLAYAQAHFADPDVKASLTSRVAASGAVLYGARRSTWRTIGRFFSVVFPVTVWQTRWFLLVSATALFLPAIVLGTWVAHSHAALDALAPAAVRESYVNHDFASYYSSEPSVDFASQVYTNNVLVSFEAFAGGIAFGLLTLVALFVNGANLGAAAGMFYAAHHPGEFWGLITPHGLLELSSVVLAGGAGLRLGWALISPGDRPRSQALTQEARGAIVLVLGTVFTLAVSGAIEGFVTGSRLPTAARVGIGVAVELAFLAWVVLCSRAARAGPLVPQGPNYQSPGPTGSPGSQSRPEALTLK